jgi:hypothetical protein
VRGAVTADTGESPCCLVRGTELSLVGGRTVVTAPGSTLTLVERDRSGGSGWLPNERNETLHLLSIAFVFGSELFEHCPFFQAGFIAPCRDDEHE